MTDINTNDDVKLLVDTFYARAREDDFISPIFVKFIDNWDRHHIKLYQFWRTVILKQKAYSAKPVQMHFKMPLTQAHFDRWLEIWIDTVDNLFEGENAEIAKFRGKKMASAFLEIIERNR